MKRVYLPNCHKDYDVSDVERFGELKILTEGKVNIFDIPKLASDIKESLALAEQQDYLILGGSPVVNSLCFAYLMMKFAIVNLLIFDAKTRTYEARTITDEELMR